MPTTEVNTFCFILDWKKKRKMGLRTSERAEGEGNKENSKVIASKIEP